MINHIDLGTVLRRTVCDLYSDLVTRPTGAAVRSGIEQQLAELSDPTLTIIDFSHVGLLDFSCADEIVAKLLLQYCGDAAPRDAYFVFRGICDLHLDPIETVLERHNLAIVAETDVGSTILVGCVEEEERLVWEAASRLGRASDDGLAGALGIDVERTRTLADGLCRRRLLMRVEEEFVAVGVGT